MSVNSHRSSLRLDLGGNHFKRKERPFLNFALLSTTPEQIDPTCCLLSQSWFHGRIDRLDAEQLLRNCRSGSYLVRYSDTNVHHYALSVKCVRGYLHIKIQTNCNGQVTVANDDKYFSTIPELVYYYSKNRLPIKGAEHMALLHPLPAQLL